MSAVPATTAIATRPLWWGFAPYAVLSSLLALRIFAPEAMPPWTSPLVAAGAIVTLRRRAVVA